MKKLRSIITVVLAFIICVAVLTGCVGDAQISVPAPENPDNSSANNTDKVESTDEAAKTENTVDKATNTENAADNATNTEKAPDEVTTEKTPGETKTNDTTDKTTDNVSLVGDDWEVVISYDASNLVTGVVARNEDTFQKESYNGYEGKDCNTVVDELVAAIEDAGYFVDDIDDERNSVIIEIDSYYDRDDDRYYRD